MIALKFSVNGKQLCLAGLDEPGIVSGIVNLMSGIHPEDRPGDFTISLRIAGLRTQEDQHLKWGDTRLVVGDKIQVEVLECSQADRPEPLPEELTPRRTRRKRSVLQISPSMKRIPDSENALAVRTDFSDDAAWESLCQAIDAPVGGFRAYVDFISDRDYEGLTPEGLLSLFSECPSRSFVFMIDRVALSHPEHPILVVDLRAEPGRSFRVIPSVVPSVESNLSIANIDFVEFAGAADTDGIFRGF